MAEIKVNIESYGAVGVHLPTDLTIVCPAASQVADVLAKIDRQYPQAHEILEKCACAIGDEMIARSYVLTQNCTLVLLSPVAGG
ncbi:MoaD/ThiS family protein [Acinetobacter sp. MD2(2019)]|uniref:MoaD/ThiS family protein n=1 Tax=Acinetobacter sp. MD2(2019) TaxID=2605273 RepID=UPI002D1F5EBF|nr:MoaD/ThiS family protein [Acinetobacter sp. MD2(2019)]MEB3754350.1 MoaD/ThiS family protein [Acinetobacter sp. MD2(2019)]